MYFEQPYSASQSLPPPPPAPFRPASGLRVRQRSFRCLLFCAAGICALIILAVLITLLVLYFIRYRHTVSTLLSYPDFVCGPRPCGCPNFHKQKSSIGKIVGGKDTLPFTYPWLVALAERSSTDPFCTGFIISSNAILTAAHCLNGRTPNQIQLLAKAHDLRQFRGERYNVARWFNHPEYQHNSSMFVNDIAILKITTTFAPDLQPCCLPTMQSSIYPRAQTTAVVSGWGKLTSRPSTRNSPVLQHVVMPIVDERNGKCQESIIDSTRQMCAGYNHLPIDTCSGDSGSPLLVVEYNNQN
ncbi:unnamed protein product, partial [Adineta ricciae]